MTNWRNRKLQHDWIHLYQAINHLDLTIVVEPPQHFIRPASGYNVHGVPEIENPCITGTVYPPCGSSDAADARCTASACGAVSCTGTCMDSTTSGSGVGLQTQDITVNIQKQYVNYCLRLTLKTGRKCWKSSTHGFSGGKNSAINCLRFSSLSFAMSICSSVCFFCSLISNYQKDIYFKTTVPK